VIFTLSEFSLEQLLVIAAVSGYIAWLIDD